MKPTVKQLDHLIVRAGDPRPLFHLLSETFQLPIAWPLRSYPSFTSGGVTLGNLYIEILSCEPLRDSSSRELRDARFVAMAFEVDEIEERVKELDRRGIAHGPVVPNIEVMPDGEKRKLYANAILGKMLGRNFWIDYMIFMGRLPGAALLANPGAGNPLVRWGIKKVMAGNLVFLVEYAYRNFKDLPFWSEFKNHEEKRAADKARLDAQKGGALLCRSVKEIVANVKDLEDVKARWRKFLGAEAEAAPGVWEIADGPSVRVVQSTENRIKTLVVKVSSLKNAETFLSEKGMLGALKEGELRIAPEKIFGLDVRLVE
ncbi:MAG TPA: hypothetical protein VKB86_16615 [Pyrinomonadaceae bacterium]|nr:hypothetical protein [Pyrinomonadaceae bacterium]